MRFARFPLLVLAAACADLGEVAAPTASLASSQADAAAASEAAPPTVFNVELRAENEPNGASTSIAKGQAQVKVMADGTMEFLFTVNNRSGETFNRAHIHKAAAGVNGGIHWDFLEAGIPVASLSDQPSQLRGVARARTAAVLADLLANPELYYVNVHSTAFPGGSLRGQLR